MRNKPLVIIAFLFVWINGSSQNNLLDSSEWIPGADVENLPTFSATQGSAHNAIINGTNPFNDIAPLWNIMPGANTSSYFGFNSGFISLTHTNTYRFSVWLKRENSNNGEIEFMVGGSGSNAYVRGDGVLRDEVYFRSYGNLPAVGEWYLFVGYVKGSGDANTYTGGIYSANTGQQVSTFITNGYSFNTTFTTLRFRIYSFNTNTTGDDLLVFEPSIYEVNGMEPTIQELLDPNGSSSDTLPPTAPTLSNTVQTDTTADFSWIGATDDTGVTGYKIFKDAVLEATLGNVSTYQATGLTASTSYNFTITALDAAGNESVVSNTVAITTNSSGGGSSGGGSVWTEANSVASYTGDVAIGTSAVPSGYKLAVDGHIRTREIRVDQDTWPDYVFGKNYNLLPLSQIEKYIQKNGHLPNIPSANEVETNGVELGEMNKLLLEKIEELTLYILELKKESQDQQKEIELLKIRQ
jgi:hypothetical protein